MENSEKKQFRGEYFKYLYQNELEVGLLPTPHHGPIHGSLGPLLLRVGILALQRSQPEETPGGIRWVEYRVVILETWDVRIVELWRMNKSKFLIPFMLIHPTEAVKIDIQRSIYG